MISLKAAQEKMMLFGPEILTHPDSAQQDNHLIHDGPLALDLRGYTLSCQFLPLLDTVHIIQMLFLLSESYRIIDPWPVQSK